MAETYSNAGVAVQHGALLELGFNAEELEALRRQGYVESVKRAGEGSSYWRLRFRVTGRLRTRYLGRNTDRVDKVRDELAALQSGCDVGRQLSQSVRQCKRALRRTKSQLKPVLAQLGFHYHGDTLRKIRASRVSQTL